MNFQFTHPIWLLLLIPGLAWVIWFALKSDVQISPRRRWTSTVLRVVVLLLLVSAIAGAQWLRPIEGMNVFYLLDRSDSVPSSQQELARDYVNQSFKSHKDSDKAGVLVFGNDAGLEFSPNPVVDLQKIQAVVGTERTDIAGAIRLATAAFPETGQKRIVLISDGNENIGDAIGAVSAAKPLDVTIDVVPVGASRGQDVSVQKLSLPNNLKKGQTFDVKIFAQADRAQTATVRLYRNDQYLDAAKVELNAGKNLFSFPQTLDEPGFYSYDIQIEGEQDLLPQNNRAVNFTYVRGDPTVLIVSTDPTADQHLAQALRESRLEVRIVDVDAFSGFSLAEMQTYDSIYLSNVAAGDLRVESMALLESAVRDFGVGLIALGGDQSFAAGGYRNTPLETVLPVDMELSSKKVLPSGALVLVVHATEFPNGNQWARDIAFAALNSLGPQDEMGIVLWDGTDKWLFELDKVGNKREMGRRITGMNIGDMVSFQQVMAMAHEGLKKSRSSIKHMVVFSDGDPTAPTRQQVADIRSDKITLSTVMIGGHVAPDTMTWMAENGGGRFYDVRSPQQLPQIFIKEAAVILKSAIFEEPFKPQVVAASELIRGIGAAEMPPLLGYVATSTKPRAETPILSEKGDPILAHWQFGLGRAVAFTSDARPKWGQQWLNWAKYRQFWSQVTQWSLRKLENADFGTDVTVDRGEGTISVEALDATGNFRNFLNLSARVVSPKGESVQVQLEQKGPGRYEGKFPTKEVGAYLINLIEMREGQLAGSQVLGTSVNYSPEFAASEPNFNLLRRISELGGGRILDIKTPTYFNPFEFDRKKTFQPNDLWEWFLRFAILLFPLDVAVRRIQIDRAEWEKLFAFIRSKVLFWRGKPRPVEADESLDALLARREQVRARTTALEPVAPSPSLFEPVHAAKFEDSTPTATPAAPVPAAQEKPKPNQPAETTSRLLEAKRRAQRKQDN
jgi:uncharacterized membrane protein